MTFTYTGSRTGNIFKIAQGFFMFIAILALISFFILAEWDDIAEYSIPLIILFIFFISYLINLAKQKSIILHSNIHLKKNSLVIYQKTKVNLKSCKIIVFHLKNNFNRYILYDVKSKLTIYSTIEDALFNSIKERVYIINEELESTNIYNEEILLSCKDDDKVVYNLESGSVDIRIKEKEEIYVHPKYFYIDPNFK